MLAAFGSMGIFSLEIVGDDSGIRLMARCGGTGASSFRRALGGYYPQAYIEEVPMAEDPLVLGADERVWTRSLKVTGHEALPLLTFDEDLTMPGTDPLLGIFGAMSSLGDGERLVASLVLSGKERGWAERYMAHAMSGVGSANQLAYDATRSRESPKGEGGGAPIGLIPLAVFAMVGLNVYNSWSEGDVMKAVLIGGGALVASAAGGYVYFKFLKPKKAVYLDPRQVERRVSGAVFDAEVKLHAFQGPGGGDTGRCGVGVCPLRQSARLALFDRRNRGERQGPDGFARHDREHGGAHSNGTRGVQDGLRVTGVVGHGIAGSRLSVASALL